MDQPSPSPDRERLLADASSIEEMTQTRGWQVLLRDLERLRQECVYHVLSLAASEGGNLWRVKLAMLDRILGIPDWYRKAREDAYQDKAVDRMIEGIVG